VDALVDGSVNVADFVALLRAAVGLDETAWET
jgi:hypothetical protein